MTETTARTILCLASMAKGAEFIRECERRGWRVFLLTVTELEQADWPRDSLDDIFFMPDLYNVQHVINAVSYLGRSRVIDRVVALHDLDMEAVAALREHMQLPGMNASQTRYFRDKLAMRVRARDTGIPEPDFIHILNYDAIRDYMARVRPPWLLKPRYEAGALGIKRLESEHELWPILDSLGDAQSNYLLEQFQPGTLYHVDSVVAGGKVVFAETHVYGRPLLEVVQHGGLFTSHTLKRRSKDDRALRKLNQQMLKAFGLVDGVTHSEFIEGEDGQLRFLETSARAAGANIPEMIEASTGVNLWREWAKLETRGAGEQYALPEQRQDYAGIIISLARQEYPDTSGYVDPEIVWRIERPHHAGFVVASPDMNRVETLLDDYQRRFYEDFHAALPPATESAHELH